MRDDAPSLAREAEKEIAHELIGRRAGLKR